MRPAPSPAAVRRLSFSRLISLASLGLGLVASGRADAQEFTVSQNVVFTSGVSGRFWEPRCEADADFAPAAFAPYAESVTSAASREGVFAFDTGGFFEPHGTGRFAIESDREALVTLVQALGYDALVFGAKDLQGSRTPFTLLARMLRDVNVPFVASNLHCTGHASALCDVLDDADDPVRVFDSGGERVALVGLIDPRVLTHVAVENRDGITLDALLDAARRRVAEARELGATLVIVSVDNGANETAAGDCVSFVEALPEAERPDLVVSARAGRQLLYARPMSFHPPIAAAPPGRGATVEIRRRTDDIGLEMLVRALPASDTESTALSTFTTSVAHTYCSELGQPLAGGTLTSDIDATGLADLTAAAMRIATDSEIAAVNTAMVAGDFTRPAHHRLTVSDTQVGIQFDDPMARASVDAAWLTNLARRVASRTDARLVGVTITNAGTATEAITINGRPIDSRGHYTIVVPQYLASGGDELLPPGAHFEAILGTTVRSSLIAWLSTARTTDPRAALPNPGEQLEWSFALASDVSFGAAQVDNDAAYVDTQFERADSIAYGTENRLDLIARSTRLGWENQAIARYRTTRNLGGPKAESDDVISLRSTFVWREPRVRHPVWYVPEPFGEAYVETEFTVPSARPARHFLIRPTVGTRFAFTSVLSLKLQAGGAIEAFDRSVDPSPGVGAVLALTTWQFFASGRRSGTMAGTFDWFVSGLGTGPVHTMRGNYDLAIQLNQVLGISFTTTLFAVKQPDQAFGYVLNSTANLRLRWFVRTQS